MSEKVGWRAGRSTVWLAGWLTDLWAGRLGDWLAGWLTSWLSGCRLLLLLRVLLLRLRLLVLLLPLPLLLRLVQAKVCTVEDCRQGFVVVLMLLLLPLVLLGPLLIPLLLLWLRLPLSLFVACRPSLFRCRDQPVE